MLDHGLQAFIETGRQWEAEMKRRILSSFISVPPTALYLTLDLDESCYGVTWTRGGGEAKTDRGSGLRTAEAQCGHKPKAATDRLIDREVWLVSRLTGQPAGWPHGSDCVLGLNWSESGFELQAHFSENVLLAARLAAWAHGLIKGAERYCFALCALCYMTASLFSPDTLKLTSVSMVA